MKIVERPLYLQQFKWVLLAAFGYFLIQLFFGIFSLTGYTNFRSVTTGEVLLNYLPFFLSPIIFWIFIGRAFQVQKEALIGLGIVLLSLVFNASYTIYKGTTTTDALTAYIPIIITLTAYGVFGMLCLKNQNWWQLLLVPMVFTGISVSGFSTPFEQIFETFFNSIGIRNTPFQWEIEMGNGRSRIIRPIRYLTKSMYIPVMYLFFSHVLHSLKLGRNNWWKFTAIDLNITYKKWEYSVIFWMYRLLIIPLGFSLISFFFDSLDQYRIRFIIYSVFVLVAIYMVPAFFRNFLSGQLISHKKNVGWMFFFLNIPFINFFTWLASLGSMNNTLNPEQKQQAYEKALKFSSTGIKTLIIIASLFVLLIQIANGPGFDSPLMIVYLIVGFVSITVIVLYFEYTPTLYVVLGLLLVLLLIRGFGLNSEQMNAVLATFAGTVSLVLYYAIFHLKTFNIYLDKTPEKISPQDEEE
jgi:hypothetical protein